MVHHGQNRGKEKKQVNEKSKKLGSRVHTLNYWS